MTQSPHKLYDYKMRTLDKTLLSLSKHLRKEAQAINNKSNDLVDEDENTLPLQSREKYEELIKE